MNKQDCLTVGIVIKAHGVKGNVIVEANAPDLLQDIKELVFLEIEGLPVPFFIEEIIHKSNNRFLIKFDWIDSKVETNKLINLPVLIPLQSLDANTIDYKDNIKLIIDFIVIDSEYGELGIIVDVISNNINPLMIINGTNKKELLIPMHSDIIKEIDIQNKKVYIDTPEGLIDLYL